MTSLRFLAVVAGVVALAGACGADDPRYETVLADLDEPRGLLLDAEAVLCVIEAGTTGSAEESGASDTAFQNETGTITCIDADLGRRSAATGLPYAKNRFSGVSVGATDLTMMDGELYVLIGEGFDETSRTILRLDQAGGRPTIVADFLAYARATTDPDFFDEIIITSNPFALLADPVNRRFLVTDGASGEVFSVAINGTIDVYSTVDGHEVLTGLTLGPARSLFVASFSELPHTRGSGSIVQVATDGTSRVVVDDLTTPIDLAFDSRGRLYVLEFVDAADPVHPYDGESGRLLRFERGDGDWKGPQVLVDGLAHPTSMLIGPNDEIYISVGGAFSAPHSGSVIRFDELAAG